MSVTTKTETNPKNSPFLAPAIVAALVWLALALYLLLVVGQLFNLEAFFAKPEQMQLKVSPAERWFVELQRVYGIFWTALFGFLGCGLAALRRSARLANLMIVLGIAALAAVLWTTLPHAK